MTGLKLQACEEPGPNVEFQERRFSLIKQKYQCCSGESKGKVESMFVWPLTRFTYRAKKKKTQLLLFFNKELQDIRILIRENDIIIFQTQALPCVPLAS